MTETLVVNLPVERVYSVLLEYFSRAHLKVKRSLKPSLIEVVVGSLLSSNPYNVKVETVPENGKTLIKVNFDFAKMYALCLIALTITFVIFGMPFGLKGLGLLIAMEAIILAIGVPRTTNTAKKSFMDKVTEFLKNAEQAKR